MFGRLLKHEFRASSGIMLLLSGIMLGIGAAAGLAVKFMNYFASNSTDGLALTMLFLASILFVIFSFIALIAYSIGTWIVLLIRFYQNKFTDEGYLTFTLPVSSHQILLSSYLNIAIWTVVVTLVAQLSVGLATLIGASSTELFSPEALKKILSALGTIPDYYLEIIDGDVAVAILSVLNVLITAMGQLMMILMSITLGAVLAKKYKILAAIGFYYVGNMAISIITGVYTFVVTFAGVFTDSVNTYSLYILVPTLILRTAVLIISYIVTIHFMSKKLNLP